jgi:hypothetical protein
MTPRTNTNSRMPALLRAAVLLVVVSCAHGPAARQASFDPGEYAAYAGPGTASVEGQVSFATPDAVKSGRSGCREVWLDPVTTYSSEWFEREILNNESLSNADSRALTYRRTVQPDGTGFFRFERLPAGSYFIACRVQFDRWIMTGMRPTMFEETAWVHARVTVGPGEQGHVVLR